MIDITLLALITIVIFIIIYSIFFNENIFFNNKSSQNKNLSKNSFSQTNSSKSQTNGSKSQINKKVIYVQGHFTDSIFKNLENNQVILFGDNINDRYRASGVSRIGWGGQAKIAGKYDRDFTPSRPLYIPKAYGITTTYQEKTKDTEYIKKTIDKEFDTLKNCADINEIYIYGANEINTDIYETSNANKIIHSLGIGIARLPIELLLYIQDKLDNLEK